MSDTTSSSGTPFDLDRLQQLIEMMEKHGLSEVNLKRGDEEWQLRRGGREVVAAAPMMPYSMPGHLAPSAMPAPPATATTQAAAAAPTASAEAAGLIDIKSPTVGTFYASPSPGEAPFVSVGTAVTPETIVCLIEAMKVFNQIPAEVSGTIAAILVKSGDPIEFGQPLFRVKP